jgi:hypothetical protein
MMSIWVMIVINLTPGGFETVVERGSFASEFYCTRSLKQFLSGRTDEAPINQLTVPWTVLATAKCQEIMLPPAYVMVREREKR